MMMMLFSEMPFLMLPTAILASIVFGRLYTLIAERVIDCSVDSDTSGSNSDMSGRHIRHV